MIRAVLLTLVLAATSLAATSVAAWGEGRQAAVFELIAARLALMQPVAAWKHLQDQPVEDLAREAVVLERATTDAMTAGPAADSVRPFFQAQIAAAKDVQRCLIDRWRAGVPLPKGEPPDLATTIRPQLIDLGNRLIAALRDALAAGDRFDDRAAPAFAATVETECLGPEARDAIYAALARIRLAGEAAQ